MRWITVLCLTTMLTLAAGAAAADVIPLEGMVPDAAAAHVTTEGLTFVGDIASQLLGQFDVASLLYGLNPLFNLSSCELIFKGSANITNVSIDQIDVALHTTAINGLQPVANGLYVDIQISPAAGQQLITVGVAGWWGIGCTTQFNATGSINATPLELAASITVAYTPDQKGFVVTVHEVKLNSADITVNFTGLPDPSLGPLLQELILDIMPPLLEAMAPQLINDAIAQQLAGITLQGTSQVAGYTIVYAFDPSIATNTHGVDLGVDGQLYLQGTTVDPCIDPGPEIGSPYTNGTPPVFGTLTPSGQPYDIGIAISDNLLNQLMYSFIAKGALCMMYPFTFDENLKGSGFPGAETAFPVPPALKGSGNLIDLYPVDLPRFVIGQGPSPLELVSNPYRLDWYIQEQGRWVQMLTAEIDLDLSLSMTITAGNALKITLENSSIQFDVRGSDYNVLPPALIQTLLNTLINTVLLPMLSDALPTIPLPTLLGYQIVLQDIGDMGAQNNYFGLYCDFVPTGAAGKPKAVIAPLRAGANHEPAPRTAVRLNMGAVRTR